MLRATGFKKQPLTSSANEDLKTDRSNADSALESQRSIKPED